MVDMLLIVLDVPNTYFETKMRSGGNDGKKQCK